METESKSIENVLNAEVEMSATAAGPESIDISMEKGDQRNPSKVAEDVQENGKHESLSPVRTTTTTTDNNPHIEQPSPPVITETTPKSPPKPERTQSLELEFSNITEMTSSLRPNNTTNNTISKKTTKINLL